MSNRYRNPRANRWEEITHQEQLILAKKREIEKRLKSTEVVSSKKEANILLSNSILPPSSSSLSSLPSSASKMLNSSSSITSISSPLSSQLNPITGPAAIMTPLATLSSLKSASSTHDDGFNNSDAEPKPAFINKFSNDGSFMEMFKKMQQKNSNQSPSSSLPQPEMTTKEENNVLSKMEDIDERVKPTFKLEEDHQQQLKKVSPSEDVEIRMAIEKSAIYVTMNGAEAETRLKNDFINDADYRWLYQENDVNHQYYKRRVEELKEAKTRAADFELSSSPTLSTSEKFVDPSLSTIAQHDIDDRNSADSRGKKRKESRWSEQPSSSLSSQTTNESVEDHETSITSPASTRDPELIAYALRVYGGTDLTADQWKQLEDQRKMNVLVEMLKRKRAKRAKLEASGREMYEYDSDEEVDGGTWEHRKRMEEMEKTKKWAEKLTEMNKGKHHIGDFLPPDQLERFMKKWDSIKDGSTSLLFDEDYADFKLQSENTGYKMLEKLGWSEGQGLGLKNEGTTKPIDVDPVVGERSGLGTKLPDQLKSEDDEYEAYRKRMMLAYRFRPNPLNNPRRPYY